MFAVISCVSAMIVANAFAGDLKSLKRELMGVMTLGRHKK